MKKSIVKKMMARILSNPYQSINGLVRLICIKKQEEKYTVKDLKECFPFLRQKDLEINRLSETLEVLEKRLIKRINFLAQDEDKKNLYELTVLLLALDTLIDGDYEPNGIIKNDRVQLCYDLAMLIDNCMAEESEFWLNENLKKLSFR